MRTVNLTSNLKLQKPTSDEKYNVQTQNTNMDILDSSIKTLLDKDATLTKQTDFILHTENKNNPHNVTKGQLGLSNVVNQRQISAIQTTVVDGGIPVFDGNGYTLKDSGFTLGTSVPANAEFTDTLYVHPESSVVPGEYTSVSVNSSGHVIYGNNPATLAEYGITDAASINHYHTAEEVGADVVGSADSALNQAKEYIDLKIAGQHGENILKKQIVESLPTQDIDMNTIYLVLKQDTNENDHYNEYINLDGTAGGYEWIGNTFVDLADYYNKTESNNLFLLKGNVSNNLTTTDEGKVLDARQGKILHDKLSTVATTSTYGIGKPDDVTIGVTNGIFETKFKNFTNLSQLGLIAPATCLEIATAMPDSSRIVLNNLSVSDIADNGTVVIERDVASRVYAYCYSSQISSGSSIVPRFWAKNIRIGAGGDSGWVEYLSTNNIANSLSSTDKLAVLAAPQGKVLDDKITDLNLKLGTKLSGNADRGAKFNTSGSVKYYTKNGWCFVSMELTPSSDVAHNDIVCSNLPLPLMLTTFISLSTASSIGGNYSAILGSNGTIAIYYPGYKTASRIDYSFSYPVAE